MAKSSKSTIDADLVRTLASLLEETGLSEIEYGKDGLNIRVTKPSKNSPVAIEPEPMPAADRNLPLSSEKLDTDGLSFADHPGAVISPMVGVIYTAPDPNSPPFVQTGEQVSEGQTLFLIEAMKVFNEVVSDKSGSVTGVLVVSGDSVTEGDPLIIVSTDPELGDGSSTTNSER